MFHTASNGLAIPWAIWKSPRFAIWGADVMCTIRRSPAGRQDSPKDCLLQCRSVGGGSTAGSTQASIRRSGSCDGSTATGRMARAQNVATAEGPPPVSRHIRTKTKKLSQPKRPVEPGSFTRPASLCVSPAGACPRPLPRHQLGTPGDRGGDGHREGEDIAQNASGRLAPAAADDGDSQPVCGCNPGCRG